MAKAKPSTNRKSTSAAITRAKAKKQWWATFRRRLVITLLVAIGAYLSIGGWWMHKSGQIDKAMHAASDRITKLTLDAGLVLREIEIVGNQELTPEMIKTSAQLQEGQALVFVSLSDTLQQLNTLPEVRHASIRRQLPDRLVVTIDERRPVAIWQHNGAYQLIDQDGIILENRALDTSVKDALLVVGEDAPEHTQALREWLPEAPALYPHVDSAVRVGKRRWDIHLKSGLKILLPETEPDVAWRELQAMQEEQAILAKALEVIDMRVEGKLFLQLKEKGAQETTHSMRQDI